MHKYAQFVTFLLNHGSDPAHKSGAIALIRHPRRLSLP